MGAAPFEQYADGVTVAAAFRTARDAADCQYGHGYSGSIAEKDSYVVVTRQVMDLDDAYRLACDLINRRDQRVEDKWGPAEAIPVRLRTRTVVVDDLSGTLDARGGLDTDALAPIARVAERRGLIGDGETVTAGRLRSYTTPRHRTPYSAAYRPRPAAATTYRDGVAELTVERSPDVLAAQTSPDGWLFFGWASS